MWFICGSPTFEKINSGLSYKRQTLNGLVVYIGIKMAVFRKVEADLHTIHITMFILILLVIDVKSN